MNSEPLVVGLEAAAALPEINKDVQRGFEVKFRLSPVEADDLETWARGHLAPDPYGDEGVYHTTSLYLDTALLDVYHKARGFRRNKYRVRRYGSSDIVHLERKTRRGDSVHKRRHEAILEYLDRLEQGDGEAWFARAVRLLGLRPVCWVGYRRSAFHSPDRGLRLTFDRDVVGVATHEWSVPRLSSGKSLLSDVVVELKYRDLPSAHLPLLDSLVSKRTATSKYRLCVDAWGLAGEKTCSQ